uniref:Ig-like domain-containing protein n=1 Tax=Sphaeramia orbicularis TaxID=375764 RepID=A0A673C9X5_9TELE
MTPLSLIWTLSCLVLVNSGKKYTEIKHYTQVSIVNSIYVTLQCEYHDKSAVLFFWYKQTLAQKPQRMSSYYEHNTEGSFNDEFKDNPRFSLDNKNSLTISDLRISDSAMYFCGSTNLDSFYFAEGVTVRVEGSYLNVQTSVRQSESESVHPGDSVTLNCTVHTGTCDGEHSVYWFKSYEEEPQPGIIYTHRGRNDQCEKKNDTETKTHTCVYNLPIHSVDHTHDQTYCAVASCGRVLFGPGTRLDLHNMKESSALVYFLSGALAFTTTLIVLLTFSVYRLKQRTCQCTGNCLLCYDAQNLHYAALKYENTDRARRPRRQKDDTFTECVYSSVYQ